MSDVQTKTRLQRIDWTRKGNRYAVPTQLYFIACDCPTGTVKIGIASNVKTRLSNLQVANPYALSLIKRVPDGAHLETSFHAEFAEDRLLGEWFRKTDALMERIAGLDGTQYVEGGEPKEPIRIEDLMPVFPWPADDDSFYQTTQGAPL